MSDYYTRPDGTQIAISAMGRDQLIDALDDMTAQRDLERERLHELMAAIETLEPLIDTLTVHTIERDHPTGGRIGGGMG